MAGFCTTCGHARTAEERFCQQCGTQISSAETRDEEVVDSEQPTASPTLASENNHRATLFAAVAGGAVLAVVAVWLVSQNGASHPSASGVTVSQPTPAPRTASPTVSASPTEDAAAALAAKQKRQARRLVAIIGRSSAARAKVVRGVALVDGCQNADAGVSLLRDAISGRSSVLTQLATVTVTALPNGKRMVAELEEAQRDSLRADQAYLGWANGASIDCYYGDGAYHEEQYAAGVRASGDAQVAKRKFLRHWDDVADLTGVRHFESSDI